MTEINHQPPPKPAQAITADKLLELEMKRRERFGGRRIGTGFGALDGLFGGDGGSGKGGFERGTIVGVSAEGREGEGILLSLNTLATLLRPYIISPTATTPPKTPIAQIIDTSGSFPLTLLSSVLKSRLQNHNATNPSHHLQKALELISITRVFDVEGLWEVLREVSRPDEEEEGIQILLIDNFTYPINELFSRRERADAHTNLAHLSKTLHLLTRNNNLLTILLNGVTATNAHYQNVNLSYQNTAQNQPPKIKNTKSIFDGNYKKPALGQLFTQFIDLHVFLSKVVRGREKVEGLISGDGIADGDEVSELSGKRGSAGQRNYGGIGQEEGGIEYCFVAEVLMDDCVGVGTGSESSRYGEREGKWIAFEVEGVGFKEVVF